jgi:hypothetical protein
VLIHAVDAGSLDDEPTAQLADEIAYDAGDRTAAMTNALLLVTARLTADHTHANFSDQVAFTTHAAKGRHVA